MVKIGGKLITYKCYDFFVSRFTHFSAKNCRAKMLSRNFFGILQVCLLLQFTAFNMEPHFYCGFDHLTIVDGDGTILMEKSCGSTDDGTAVIGGHGGQQSLGSSLPADIRSRSNTVNLLFKTSFTGLQVDWYWTGWSVSWSAVTSGECKKYIFGQLVFSLLLN